MKKIIGVSDLYWLSLYSPMLEVVERCLRQFPSRKQNLADDFCDQFVKTVRRNKGGTLDNPINVHVDNFGLAAAFVSIYLGLLVRRFDFISISKKTGGRTKYYPWLSVPTGKYEFRLQRLTAVAPLYSFSASILFELLSAPAKKWLHDNHSIYSDLVTAVATGGEKGRYSSLLCFIEDPLKDVQQVASETSKSVMPVAVPSADSPEAKSASSANDIDDLISALGGTPTSTNLEDLFNANTKSSNEASASSRKGSEQDDKIAGDSSQLMSDFASFLDGKTEPEITESNSPAVVPVAPENDSLDIDDFLSASPPPEFAVEQNSIEAKPEAHLTDDFIAWGEKQLKLSTTGFTDSGIFLLNFAGDICFGFSDQTILHFVKDDWDMDNEEGYQAVAGEVKADISRSGLVVDNDGQPDWVFEFDGKELNLQIIKLGEDTLLTKNQCASLILRLP